MFYSDHRCNEVALTSNFNINLYPSQTVKKALGEPRMFAKTA